MRRKVTLSTFALLVLAALVFLVPQLVSFRQVQDNLALQAGKALKADVIVGKMRWRWGPLPHLTLYETKVIHADYTLHLQKIRLYPDWKALFRREISLGRVYLLNPDATIQSSFFTANGSPPAGHLPLTGLTIDNGRLNIASFKKGTIQAENILFDEINVSSHKKQNSIFFSLQTSPSFSNSLSAEGIVDPVNLSYSATVKAKQVRFDKLLHFATEHASFQTETVDFISSITGRGSESFQLHYAGDLPDFSLKRLEENAFFSLKDGIFLLSKNGPEITLDIEKIAVQQPQVSFAGHVSKYYRDETELPFYKLDLSAAKIDLTGVRSHLLTLLGDNSITQTVCNTVLAGKAHSATYFFDAPLKGFEDLSKMLIKVEVDEADIHIPEVNLDLHKASGPIIIKNSVLAGKDLTSWLDNHYGFNGSFSLALSENNSLFTLDLDIDADLSTLPQILHDLIKEENFRDEVLKFSSTGRKKGHLTIGDDLTDFDVEVVIEELGGSEILYDRVKHPVQLKQGRLHIKDETVNWQHVSALIGPYQVHETSGLVSWGADSAPWSLHSIKADLDAESLLTELNLYPVIKSKISDNISELTGSIAINKGSIHGPFLNPALWQYEIDTEIKGATLTTRHLPDLIEISHAQLIFTQEKVQMPGADVLFLGSPLQLSSDLLHSFFSNWQGVLEINGELSPSQANWLKGKDWIPEPFFPRIANHLRNFKINFGANYLNIFGSLLNKSLYGYPVEAVVDVKIMDGRHISTNLHFFTEKEDGLITITGDGKDTDLQASFKGRLDKKTVAAILSNQTVLGGELDGFFTFSLPGIDRKTLSFSGSARGQDIQWVWGNYLRQFSIKNISLTGENEKILINDLVFLFENQTVRTNGELLFSPDSVQTDLTLQSNILSQNTLTHFIDDLFVFLDKISGITQPEKDDENSFSKKITGQIKLEADEFIFAETLQQGKSSNYKLTSLLGSIDFSDQLSTSLHLKRADFCGMNIDGILRWEKDQSRKDFAIHNFDTSLTYFEKFLPCAGVEKDILSGPFTLKANLTDENGTLTSGKFRLHAEDGTLKKMAVLSKIFKLINFTDLYQGLFSTGFRYKVLEVYGHVEKNKLILGKAVMEGEGLDIMAQGSIDLNALEADLTFYIVPLKSIDKIINFVPLIGRIVGGKKRHIITFPVRVTGNIKDPNISVLSPGAIGKAAIDFVFDTLTLPLELLPGFSEDPYGEEVETSGEDDMKVESGEK